MLVGFLYGADRVRLNDLEAHGKVVHLQAALRMGPQKLVGRAVCGGRLSRLVLIVANQD